MNNAAVFKKFIGVNVCCFFNREVSKKTLPFDGYPLRENLFGLLMLLLSPKMSDGLNEHTSCVVQYI